MQERARAFFPFAQRRQSEGEAVQAIVKIASQLATGHRLGGVMAGGRQDADIQRRLRVVSDGQEPAAVQHINQSRLQTPWQGRDFIQHQGSTTAGIEPAELPVSETRVIFSCAPEQFPFQHILSEIGAMQCLE
jgi:hypothetical protein